ncbi:MAG: ABC transporter ATP-binding protein [Polyangiaceae bacterium]|nr:ABC transporter ATP-binding protein [Polyangiaceae bacterium]
MNEPVLITEALSRRFGTVVALSSLDLAIGQGEIYGLVGPDGAGKTTAMRLVAGVIGASSGRVLVRGQDPLGNESRVRDILGYMPQQYSLYGDLTVAENLRFFASVFSLGRADFQARKERLLGITRLERFVDRRADALSGGMYKKLALACALLHRPELLALDEPTNGVDPVSRREFWDLLRALVREGMTILLSTPYMDEAARCHRVGLIHQGRLLLEGEPQALLGRFAHRVFRIQGGQRDEVLRLLEQAPEVLGTSPAGARLRAVVRADFAPELDRRLGALGSTLVPTPPDFEDLFVARLHEEQPGGRA